MFPRWVQPSALGTPDRVHKLEEPSFREPTRGVLGECALCVCGFYFFWGGVCAKCIFEEALLSWKSGQPCDEETCLLLGKEVSWFLQVCCIQSSYFVVVCFLPIIHIKARFCITCKKRGLKSWVAPRRRRGLLTKDWEWNRSHWSSETSQLLQER